MRNNLTIYSHSANSNELQEMITDLSGYNIDVKTLSEKDFGYNFLTVSESVETPILLLLSYNWLRDSSTLYNSLPVLTALKESNKLYCVVVDGHDTQKGRIATKFDKVKDVIPYMKYWQETFFQARTKRQEDKSAESIEVEYATKSISLNFGDIINFFRAAPQAKLNTLKGSNYQPIFDHFNFTVEKVENLVSPPKEAEETLEGSTAQFLGKSADAIPDVSGFAQAEEHLETTNVIDSNEELLPVFDEPVILESKINSEIQKPEVETTGKDVSSLAKEESVTIDISKDGDLVGIETEKPLENDGLEKPLENDEPEKPLENDELELESQATPEENAIEEILGQAINFFNANEDDKAFELFETNIQNNHPDITTIRYYYAYYLAQRKSAFDDAIHQLDTILLYDSQNDNAYFLLAELAEIKGNYALAKNYYLQTLAINPNYPNINFRIGVILSEQFMDSHDEASKYLAKELAKTPDNIDALYQLGIIQSDLGQYTEAKENFQKVLGMNPSHDFANYDLALIHHKENNLSKAAFYYKKGCINNPELKTEQNDQAFLTGGANESTSIEQSTMETKEVVTKNILITGATSGIGLATAEKFAKEGACRLILTGRRRNRLTQIVEVIKETYDIEVMFLQFDIRDVLSVREALGTLEAPFDTIDVLVNNAGLALGLSSIADGDLNDWETMIDTNIKGLLYTTKEVVPRMIAAQKGHIINIGSIAGREAYPNGNVYNATKAAVDILTKAMRLDLYQHNIRVGQVAPGHVETEFAINRFHGDEEKASIYDDFTPLSPRDIANIIYFMVHQPEHVNIQDVLVFPTQQANATSINRNGRG